MRKGKAENMCGDVWKAAARSCGLVGGADEAGKVQQVIKKLLNYFACWIVMQSFLKASNNEEQKAWYTDQYGILCTIDPLQIQVLLDRMRVVFPKYRDSPRAFVFQLGAYGAYILFL